MDWNERFKEAHAMWEQGEYSEAADIFEEVAEATMDPSAINMTIFSKNVLIQSDMGMFNAGMPVIDHALDMIDSELKWINIARQNETIMNEQPDGFADIYRTCMAYKGKYLYVKSSMNEDKTIDNGCEAVLSEAVSLGDNQSRIFLALRCMDYAGALVDEGDEGKVGQISEYYSRMVRNYEEYIDNYNPEEADADELRMAAKQVSLAYSSGMGAPKDPEKAQKYAAIAETFNEETKTSNPAAYVPKAAPANQGNSNASSGGCYIATAVYGSYDCPEVWTLRRYRDERLLKTTLGRIFVKIYYATSPTIVKHFGDTDLFNRFWRGRLNKFVEKLQNDGYDNTPYYDR